MEKMAQKIHASIFAKDKDSVISLLKQNNEDAKTMCEFELPRDGTALHKAAKVNDVEICQIVIDTGMDINTGKSGGFVVSNVTPLHCAVGLGHREIAKCLISNGANVNCRDSDEFTPLHSCFQGDKIEMIKLLLENGADPDSKDSQGQTPLHRAIIRSVALKTIKLLIDSNIVIDSQDKAGQTPLHYAAEWGSKDLVELLIFHGANINFQDNDGRAPIHVATEPEVKEILLKHGADSGLRTNRGQTAFKGRIDLESETITNLNDVLSRHSELSQSNRPDIADSETKTSTKKFQPSPPLQDASLHGARSNVLKELLVTRAKINPTE